MSLLSAVRSRWTVSLGFAMIILGGYMLWINRDYLNIYYVLSQASLMLFGVIMLLNPVKTVMNNVAIYALGLGISRIIKALPYVFSQTTEVFLAGCGVMAVGASMLYTGYMFINGKARAYRRMIYTATAVSFVLYYFVALLGYGDVESLITLWKDEGVLVAESVLMCLMYGILAFVLMDERISSRGFYEVVENELVSTTDITNLPERIYISSATAQALTDRDDPAWHTVDDGGPAELRYDFDVHTDRISLLCISQIWKGDGRVHFNITANRTGTMIQALRFSAERMVLDGDRLTLVGGDGLVLSFLVDDGHIAEEASA